MLIFLLLLLHFPTFPCEDFQDLPFLASYSNWSTKGNLAPTLFRVVLDTENPPFAIRVSVTSENVTLRNPLTLNVIRGKTVHNIALPRIQSHQGQKHTYWFASDTLCDDDRSMEQLGQPVYLSVASSLPSDFQILVKPVPNFHYQEPFSTLDTPSEPRYFMYTFPNAVDKVDIRAYSETEICARLTVRRVDCPLFDGFGMLELSNDYYFQTFTKFAGFSIRKEDIGDQFHIAFTVMPDDTLCGNFTEPLWKIPDVYHRVKEAKISVTPVEEKTLVSVIPLFIYAASIIFVLLLTYFKYRLLDRHENNEPSIFEGNDLEGNVKLDKQWLFENPGEKIVSHHEYQKQRLIKDSKYFNFLFFQIFGSILPALTTLFQNYQKTSNKQNLDKCYLNYLCSLQIFNFNSLNSVASASSLAIVGILNLIIVFRKKIFCYQVPRIPTTHGIQQRDAPKVVCLLGCVAMGILGIITNNCPNKSTLHIFIYTCLWIFHSAIMWIYSKRHGVRRWHQFYIIAVSSIFGCLAFAENIFESTESSTTPLKIIFLLVTISSTGFFCYKYYFERPSGLQVSQWIPSLFSTGPTLCDANGVYRPLKSKICYMVLAMGFSVYIPVTALLNPKNTVIYSSFDWAKGQVGIYFCYYLIQKIRFERSSFTMSFKIICYGTTAIFLISETFIHDIFYHQLRTYSVQPLFFRTTEMNRKKTEADRKLLKLLESDGDEAVLGDEFKSELVKQIMIKSVESDEYCASGRALCTQCKTLLSATDGGHVFRHLDRCTGKRAASEPIPETSDESLRSVEPLAKQRKLTGVPTIVFVFPCVYVQVSGALEYLDMAMSNIAMIWLLCHRLASTITMLTVHKPYRDAVLEIVLCKAKKSSVVVSPITNSIVKL
ncbi:hypothetical protein L3Y34_009553 [Caenorhabditis briggsae]|uniref:SID1 transmembrane family member 1 n=1 Tax=Caenorhabditis briggsae TaxID=6238 RepID=A0AAE9D230_CAEBR|nr:hypothetical protein L3Y34_009553 [Caenorhabditis briggsae]